MEGSHRKSGTVNPGIGIPDSAGIFFVLMGLAGLVLTLFFSGRGRQAEGDPGSLMLPVAASGLMLIGGLILAICSGKRTANSGILSSESESAEESVHWRGPAILCGVLVVLIALLEAVGIVPLFVAGFAVYLKLLDGRSWGFSLLSGVIATGLIVFVFSQLLHIPLPGGFIRWP